MPAVGSSCTRNGSAALLLDRGARQPDARRTPEALGAHPLAGAQDAVDLDPAPEGRERADVLRVGPAAEAGPHTLACTLLRAWLAVQIATSTVPTYSPWSRMTILVWLFSNSPPAMAGEFTPMTMPSDATTTTSSLVARRDPPWVGRIASAVSSAPITIANLSHGEHDRPVTARVNGCASGRHSGGVAF